MRFPMQVRAGVPNIMTKYDLLLLVGLFLVACDEHPPPAPSLPPLDASVDAFSRDFGSDVSSLDGGLEDASGSHVDGISCLEIHQHEPTWSSACYTIDPDGSGPEESYRANCDMTTMGGGWTLVFIPHRSGDYATNMLQYSYNSLSLFISSTEFLIAQRNLNTMEVVTTSFDSSTGGTVDRGNPVRFPMPNKWRTKSPFEYLAETETVDITTEDGITIHSVLKYGYARWVETPTTSYDCERAWWTDSGVSWTGRLCIIKDISARETDPNVAAFWGFGADGRDTCNSSSGWSYAPDDCAIDVAFTIAIR